MSSSTRGKQMWSLVAAVVLTMTIAGSIGFYLRPMFRVSDSNWYLALAAGHESAVIQPFASRQLGPLVVRAVVRLAGWTIERAFVVQGIFAMLVLLTFVYTRALRTAAPRWLLAALVLVPFWPELFNGLVLPDLWYSALLSIFLLLLGRQQYMLAACMMFPLMVSRESTLLTLACFVFAGWRGVQWKWTAVAVVTAVAGMVVVKRLTAMSPSNGEHLPQAVYMLAKVPWNFMRNVLGITPWSNVYTRLCSDGPTWQHAFHAGPVRAIGECGVSSFNPLRMLRAFMSVFGMLPLLTAFLWRRLRAPAADSVLLRFCLSYGVICFLLTPVMGFSFSRLLGYSWPLFLVALPMLFDRLIPGNLATVSRHGWPAFLGLHFAIYLSLLLPLGAAVSAEVLLNLAGCLLMRRWWNDKLQAMPAEEGLSLRRSA